MPKINLELLNLTKNEQKAYLSLIKLGKSTASAVAKDSGVPYSRIYDTLASLEHKGFIKTLPEKTKQFIPSDPEKIKAIVEKKRSKLEELEESLTELTKIYEITAEKAVQMAEGKKNFYKILDESIKPKKYDYAVKYTSEFRPVFVSRVKDFLKRGVKVKELVKVSADTKDNIKKWLKINKDIKKIDNDGVAIDIKDDKEVVIALIKKNTILKISDPAFAKVMRILFEKSYSVSEEVRF